MLRVPELMNLIARMASTRPAQNADQRQAELVIP
jgi:hypothetical protein